MLLSLLYVFGLAMAASIQPYLSHTSPNTLTDVSILTGVSTFFPANVLHITLDHPWDSPNNISILNNMFSDVSQRHRTCQLLFHTHILVLTTYLVHTKYVHHDTYHLPHWRFFLFFISGHILGFDLAYVAVEAREQFKMIPTAMSNIWKEFNNLYMLCMLREFIFITLPYLFLVKHCTHLYIPLIEVVYPLFQLMLFILSPILAPSN